MWLKKKIEAVLQKPTGNHAKGTSNAEIQNACYRYGSLKYKANFKSCPVLGQMCCKCGKKDHYAKVCLADDQPKVHNLRIMFLL